MKPIPTIQPTPEQAEKIFDLFIDLDPDFVEGTREAFMRDGQALFAESGNLKATPVEGEIFIKGGQIGDWFIFSACYLTPIKEEGLFVRLDLDHRDDESIEVEIFVHRLEDIEKVRDFVVGELLAAHMRGLAEILGDHVPHDAAVERLRGIIAASTVKYAHRSRFARYGRRFFQ